MPLELDVFKRASMIYRKHCRHFGVTPDQPIQSVSTQSAHFVYLRNVNGLLAIYDTKKSRVILR